MKVSLVWSSTLTLKGPIPYEVRGGRTVLKGVLKEIVVGPTGVMFVPDSVMYRSGQAWISGNSDVSWSVPWSSLPQNHLVAGETSFRVPGGDLMLFEPEVVATPAHA